MSGSPEHSVAERVVIFAPSGNDAENVVEVLRSSGIHAVSCEDLLQVGERFVEGAGALLLAEEGLDPDGVARLSTALAAQPNWSDIPVLIVTRSTEAGTTGQRLLALFAPHGNVALLERPLHPISLISTLQGALRARRKQYEVRAILAEQQRALRRAEEMEQRFRAIFNQQFQFIAILSPEGVALEINELPCRATGIPREAVIGRPFWETPFWKDLPKMKAEWPNRLAAAARSHGPMFSIDEYRTSDGQIRVADASVTAVKDQAGQLLFFIVQASDITERKQAEDALRDSEERFRAIVETTPECVKIVSRDGTLLAMNEAGCRMVEAQGAGQVVGTSVYSLVTPDFRDKFQQFNENVCRGMSGQLDFEIVGLNGTRRWVETHAVPMREPSTGEIVQLAVTRDVTARKETEEKMRRSEDELRALANSIPQLAWIAHPDGHIFWYNQRWYEYTGATFEQMEGWGWKRVHDPAILPRVLERWEESIRTGNPFDMEFPLRGADGVFRWFLTRVNPVHDLEGRVVRWFGTNTNVDEVRRTRETLQDETRILELLNNTGKAIAAQLDIEKLLQIVTDAATKLCGAQFGAFFYNVSELNSDSYSLYTISGAAREAFERFGAPRATPLFGPTFRGEGVILSDDILSDPRYGKMAPHHGMPKGHLPVRSYLAVPVVSRDGEVIGGLFFGHSQPGVFTPRSERLVSGVAAQAAIAIDNARLYETAHRELAERQRVADELRKAQVELSRHADSLEKEVEHRTASLRDALAQLEEFSYSVSHDLRAPIRAIGGYTQILLSDYGDALPGEAREFLEKISRSTDRMNRLVNDVLTMSRVARADLRLQPIPLQAFVEEIVEQHAAMQPPSAELTVQTPHAVLADNASLNQALSNLLANAVKFVASGKRPVVLVRSALVGDRVRISIEDNGIGIPPEQRGKLFGMFQRLPTDLRYEGTGIGLAIVRKAVERMGGTVGVESAPGTGSRFWIELKGASSTN